MDLSNALEAAPYDRVDLAPPERGTPGKKVHSEEFPNRPRRAPAQPALAFFGSSKLVGTMNERPFGKPASAGKHVEDAL
jgi:hypothetical protein